MLRLFRKNRSASRQAAPIAPVANNSASFGLFGVYVRSLPTLGR